MTTDLSGGIDPAREYVFAARPENPEMRDSVSFWTVDDRGRFGLPRIGIEAVAANWDNHEIQLNIAFPDGRVYRLRGAGPSLPPGGPDGTPTVLGAGGLAFRCVEPFGTWTMTYDGKAVQTSSSDLIAGRADGPLVDIGVFVEATMAVQAAPMMMPTAMSMTLPLAMKSLNSFSMPQPLFHYPPPSWRPSHCNLYRPSV